MSETDPKAQNKLAAIEAGLERLTERSELNATQIDQLQVESVKKRQWYKDPPIIIAIIALAISIVSPVVAQKNLASDRERQDQTRLVELIQQLPGLRNNNASTTDQFALVASEATQLMKRLPATPDQKLQVADAWKDAGDLLTAKELLESALTEATGSFQKATILRTLARIEFELQDYRAGRVDYERAIHTEETEMPGYLRFYFSAQDQLTWGNDELQAGNCHGARQNAQQAEALLSHLLNPSNIRADLDGDIRKFEADIAKNCK